MIDKYFSNPEKKFKILLILYKTNIESCYTCKYVRFGAEAEHYCHLLDVLSFDRSIP